MFLFHNDQSESQSYRFSCVAVPMLVPAKKDGRNLAFHTFSELYQLFLILLCLLLLLPS